MRVIRVEQANAETRAGTQWQPAELELERRHVLKLELSGFAGGVKVEIPFIVLVGKERAARALLIAGVHGDEYEGVAVLQAVAEEIDPSNLRGTLTIVPVANPQAFFAGTRRNPVDMGDLNRSFPGSPLGTASERLAHLIFHELVLGNDSVLSLHGWSKEATVVPYVEYPDQRSPVSRRSFAAARALGLEFLHPYTWPLGLLVASAVRSGIPAIEVEVGGMGTITPVGQQTYRSVINRFLRHLGMVQSSSGPQGVSPPRPKIVNHIDCLANFAGLFHSRVTPNDAVRKGEILGTVHDLAGKCLEEMRAPRPGRVAVLRTFSSVMPGDNLVRLFWETSAKKSPLTNPPSRN